MFMSEPDARHFLDDAVRVIILHHPVLYDPVNPTPKMEPTEFAEKYGKMPEGDFPIGGPEENSYFARLDPEAKRELLLYYATEFYQMLEEDAANSAVAEPELAMGISWIVTTIDYAMGMGQTFRDVRRFYNRAPLHGCAPIDTPARRFPDTSQAEDLPRYPLGATSMCAALAQGGLYAEERAQARDPSPALDQVIREGGAAVVAFPAAAQCGYGSVFSAEQQDHLNHFMGGQRMPPGYTDEQAAAIRRVEMGEAVHDAADSVNRDLARSSLREFGEVDAQYLKLR